MKQPQQGQRLFLRIAGLALTVTLALTFLYVLVGPGFSLRGWSDALCVSAMLLGIGSAAPFIFDVGRGLVLPSRMGSNSGDHRGIPAAKALQEEHVKREKGMMVTFALALAALLIAIASIAASLL